MRLRCRAQPRTAWTRKGRLTSRGDFQRAIASASSHAFDQAGVVRTWKDPILRLQLQQKQTRPISYKGPEEERSRKWPCARQSCGPNHSILARPTDGSTGTQARDELIPRRHSNSRCLRLRLSHCHAQHRTHSETKQGHPTRMGIHGIGVVYIHVLVVFTMPW